MYVISTTGALRGLGARVTDPVAPSSSPFDAKPVTFAPVREPTFTPTYTPTYTPTPIAPVKPAAPVAPVTAVAPLVPAATATTSDTRITAQVVDTGATLAPPAPPTTREIKPQPPAPTGSGDGSAGSRVEHRPPPPELLVDPRIRPDGSGGPPIAPRLAPPPEQPSWLKKHWPWLLGGAVAVGGAAVVITRKRKA